MLKFYVRHDMIVEKVHDVVHSKKVSGWRNLLVFLQKKELGLKMNLKEISINYSIMPFVVKLWKLFVIDVQ